MSKKNFMEKPVTVSEVEVVIDKSTAVCLGRCYTPLHYASEEVKDGNEAYEELYRGKDGKYFLYGNHGIVTSEIEGCAAIRPEGVDREEIKLVSYCDALTWAARFLTLEEFEKVSGRERSAYDKVCEAMDCAELHYWFSCALDDMEDEDDSELFVKKWVPNICEGFTGLDEESVAAFLKNIWHLAANTGVTL